MKKETTYSKSRPAMGILLNSVDITLSGQRFGYVVDDFHGFFYNTIINPIKGRFSHFAVKFGQSFESFREIFGVFRINFLRNSGKTYFRNGIKNPLLYGVSCYQFNRGNLSAFLKSVCQFTNQFTSTNDSRSKFQRVGENIFNNDSHLISPTEAHYPTINQFRFTLKTIAYKPTR